MSIYSIIVFMELLKLIKSEFEGFGKRERIIFPLILLFTVFVSFYTKDSKIALISALCGMSYTILAGKGRISCYFIGILGTLCYSYIAYINTFYGNLLLYALYYLPMEVIGIFKWKKHLKPDKREIIKTKLTEKEKLIYFSLTFIGWIVLLKVLMYLGDKMPYMDSFATVFSVLGLFLTVKRCIEQWYIWFFVNVVTCIMWILAYVYRGSNCLATVIMWAVYTVLAVYFLIEWKKDLKNNNL